MGFFAGLSTHGPYAGYGLRTYRHGRKIRVTPAGESSLTTLNDLWRPLTADEKARPASDRTMTATDAPSLWTCITGRS